MTVELCAVDSELLSFINAEIPQIFKKLACIKSLFVYSDGMFSVKSFCFVACTK